MKEGGIIMDKKLFKTLIRKDHKLGNNDYVKGKISGIQTILCPREFEHGNGRNEDGFILVAECEPIHYDAFKNVVEKIYPGLCEFNYIDKRS